jgi:Rieske 2Fe-2S family protein
MAEPDVASTQGMERTLSRAHYLSPEMFAREKEHIFLREWFLVGREEDLPRPGSYLVVGVAGESVLVVRTREGQFRAYYNVCRHRGCQLVLTGADSTGCAPELAGSFGSGIKCPYHAWTYTLEVALRTAP